MPGFGKRETSLLQCRRVLLRMAIAALSYTKICQYQKSLSAVCSNRQNE